MPSLENMAKVPTSSLLILLLATGAVLGCGTVPGGAAASRTWRFNVTGFSLPVAMAFSTDAAARAQAPQISPNSGSAEAFVKRLIIQGVLNVLEQQGRAAGLPDFVITTILGQLGINVLYTPLPCPKVSVNPSGNVVRDAAMMMTTCVIFGNTVTTTCLGMGVAGVQGAMCTDEELPVEKKAGLLDQRKNAISIEGESELRLNIAGQQQYELPSVDEVEKELRELPNLQIIGDRINEVVQVFLFFPYV
ncbi:hypothetical protein KIN20_014317 [Parelaphostrongylus tenuis]|uniref:Uncharacterized protein n=1 Tax=Parelaphostrongylus tenuis TaxID=148309 RepID=A0AAD5MVX5_PARTN|nr:hypothetical protein KIN20_014317 [Parelaphostrongylus tenuis]